MRTLSSTIAVSLVCFAVACGGGQPPPEESIIGGDGRTVEERELNRAALHELMDRARAEADAEGSGARAAEPRSERPPADLRTVAVSPFEVALRPDGSLRREGVDAFLAQGPHVLLQNVIVDPAREGDRALGFRLVDHTPAGAFVLEGGFEIGDIIRRVNGENIVLPEGFFAAWEGLSDADALEVELVRDGEPMTLRWPIVADTP